MVYAKKRSFARKRTYRKPYKASRWTTYGNAAKQLVSDAGTAYKWVGAATGFNTEKKLLDSGAQTQTLSTTPIVYLMNGCAQGTDYTNREGRSIKIVNFAMRSQILINPASTANQFVRVLIGCYKQPNGVAPTALQLFGSATPPINAFFSLDYRNAFEILYDKTKKLTVDWDTQLIKFYKKFQMHTIYNSGNTGGWGDVQSNGLFMMMYSDQTTNLPSIQLWTRGRFVDN